MAHPQRIPLPARHHRVPRAHEIVLGLYQGGRLAPGMTFQDIGVSAIVDLDDEPHYMPPTPVGCVYLFWPVMDGPSVEPSITRAIANCVKGLVDAGHLVLVMCAAGLNRSSLITARTLIAMGWYPNEAITRVRKSRRDPRTLTNHRFIDWLLAETPGT